MLKGLESEQVGEDMKRAQVYLHSYWHLAVLYEYMYSPFTKGFESIWPSRERNQKVLNRLQANLAKPALEGLKSC